MVHISPAQEEDDKILTWYISDFVAPRSSLIGRVWYYHCVYSHETKIMDYAANRSHFHGTDPV